MSSIDILIIVILALFVWKGVKFGLIESVGGIVGLFLGAFLASRYYMQAAGMIKAVLFNSQTLANILAFILVFIVVNRLVALAFWLVDKIFNIIAIIPLLKSLNHFLGGIFGLIEGLIFIGIIIFFFTKVPFTQSLQEKMSASRFNPIFQTIGKIAAPFMPSTIGDWQLDMPAVPDVLKNINLNVKIPQMK